jgi:hypothetical protein
LRYEVKVNKRKFKKRKWVILFCLNNGSIIQKL